MASFVARFVRELGALYFVVHFPFTDSSRLANDDALREDLAMRGLARAKLFTWEKAVKETWEVYRDLL